MLRKLWLFRASGISESLLSDGDTLWFDKGKIIERKDSEKTPMAITDVNRTQTVGSVRVPFNLLEIPEYLT